MHITDTRCTQVTHTGPCIQERPAISGCTCLQAPKPTDFDYLLQQVHSARQPAAFVFNCQMGRGRTTTGMVITSMCLLQLNGVLDQALAEPASNNGAAAAPADLDPPGDSAASAEPTWFKEGLERSLQSQARHVRAEPPNAHRASRGTAA